MILAQWLNGIIGSLQGSENSRTVGTADRKDFNRSQDDSLREVNRAGARSVE
jgi:hypothetical protein